MELVSNARDIFSVVAVFIFGAIFALKAGAFFDLKSKRILTIYIWHTFFCFIYAEFVILNGGDAAAYYNDSLIAQNTGFSVGTAGIQSITAFFSSIIGLSFLGVSLVYNVFGTLGLLAFDSCLRKVTHDKSRKIQLLATFIVFLPSISFWSAGLGKDSLSFLATGITLWSVLHSKYRYWLFGLAVFIMILVRPHISALMVLSFSVSFAIQRRVSLGKRLIISIICVAGAIILVPFAMHYAGLSDVNQLNTYIQSRQNENLEGGSSVDISDMSYPAQLFSYLFRPLPFEAHNLFSLAASLDNVILLFLFIYGGWCLIKRRHQTLPGNRLFLWIYSLSTWILLAVTTANLGIAMRQKWMFAPMLIFLFISSFNRPRKKFFSRTHSNRIERTHGTSSI